jgi:hypothetical protein
MDPVTWFGGVTLRLDGVRLRALVTLLVFLTLLTVSGPHRVHHLIEGKPPEHQHTHAGKHTHHSQAPQRPECQILFLWQHAPMAEGGTPGLPAPLLLLERAVSTPRLWVSAAPRYVALARAPPRPYA